MAEIALLLVIGMLCVALWLYDREKKRYEEAMWEISVLRDQLARAQKESDE